MNCEPTSPTPTVSRLAMSVELRRSPANCPSMPPMHCEARRSAAHAELHAAGERGAFQPRDGGTRRRSCRRRPSCPRCFAHRGAAPASSTRLPVSRSNAKAPRAPRLITVNFTESAEPFAERPRRCPSRRYALPLLHWARTRPRAPRISRTASQFPAGRPVRIQRHGHAPLPEPSAAPRASAVARPRAGSNSRCEDVAPAPAIPMLRPHRT